MRCLSGPPHQAGVADSEAVDVLGKREMRVLKQSEHVRNDFRIRLFCYHLRIIHKGVLNQTLCWMN